MSAPFPPRTGRTGVRPYAGATVVFGTRHGKHLQTAPAFRRTLGARVIAPPDLDTDQFGTFSGDVARRLTPLATAKAKAALALEVTGHRYALASEATYGPLPGIGWPGHEEILLFVDAEHGWDVLEGTRSLRLPGTGRLVRDIGELLDDLPRWGWPGQAVIVRPDPATRGSAAAGPIVKDIVDRATLAAAITAVTTACPSGQALVEPDLRAHHNPSRRHVLRRLAHRLAHRLATRCPACDSPGYGRTDTLPGLPCTACSTPTDETAAELHTCPACPHRTVIPRTATAEPRHCPACNP